MSTHVAVIADPRAFDESVIRDAKASVVKGGRLDVVVQPAPSTVDEAEEAVRKLYAYAPPRVSDLDFTVLLESHAHEREWERVFHASKPSQSTDESKSLLPAHSPANSLNPTPRAGNTNLFGRYRAVAVGGTWDHIHWGHRLMLTLAAYTAKELVVIGVTGSELLTKKQYAEALDSYDVRTKAASDFVHYLRPEIKVQPAKMSDMYGPTITMEALDALVVSHETSGGGDLVNKERAKLSWHPLDIIVAGLVPGGAEGSKLSSTDLRREELKTKNQTKM